MRGAVASGLAMIAVVAGAWTLSFNQRQSSEGVTVVSGPASTHHQRLSKGRTPSLSARTASVARHAEPISFLVPAYFYPSNGADWDAMTAVVSRHVGVTAIMNPNSGPDAPEPGDVINYRREVGELRAAGGKVIGYVPTGFVGSTAYPGCASASGIGYTPEEVANCALRYAEKYEIDGVFLDQMSIDSKKPRSEAQQIDFYTKVRRLVRQGKKDWIVIGNPGTAAPEGLLRGADTLVTFENYAREYRRATKPPYADRYAARRFANLLHTARNGFDLVAALERARERNVGYIYVTDDDYSPPEEGNENPWDRLSSKWRQQARALRDFNRGS